MTSTRGPPFTTSSAALAPWVHELNAAFEATYLDLHSQPLVLRPTPLVGWGAFARDPIPRRPPNFVAAYWGQLSESPSLRSDRVLELPPIRLGARTVTLYVDGHYSCLRGPSNPINAAWFNHACEDPSCRLELLHLRGATIPVAVAIPRRHLRRDTQLTINYDGGLTSDAAPYTISRADADLLALAGTPAPPCCCVPGGICPLDRFFPL